MKQKEKEKAEKEKSEREKLEKEKREKEKSERQLLQQEKEKEKEKADKEKALLKKKTSKGALLQVMTSFLRHDSSSLMRTVELKRIGRKRFRRCFWEGVGTWK
jgi:hypothetical protein